jgi:biotin carboxylase
MYEDVKGKRLLVLGGTRISCSLIEKAKEMGLIVGVTDYNTVEDSPGKQIAHEIYDVNALDVDAVADLIREKHFNGLLTGWCDMLLPYYAEICKKANIPCYGTKEQFEIFINKEKYKALCRQYGVPTVEGYPVDDIENAQIKYPVLVKPVDGSGSRGLSVCQTKEEMLRGIQAAKNASKTHAALVERYMTGREVTVNWLFVDGEYYLTSIANRHVKWNQGEDVIPLPVGYTYPASITPKYRTEIEDNAKAMFKATGIKNGMMFMQCKVEDDVCMVYDIGFRLTGTLEYVNYDFACGYNPLEMMIHFAVTGKMCGLEELQKIRPETMKPSFNVSILAKPGTIARIEGVEEAKAYPEVADVVIAHVPGETITENMRGLLAQITVRSFGSVDQKEQLYDAMHKVEETIRVISTEGELMNLPGIEPKDIEGVVL